MYLFCGTEGWTLGLVHVKYGIYSWAPPLASALNSEPDFWKEAL